MQPPLQASTGLLSQRRAQVLGSRLKNEKNVTLRRKKPPKTQALFEQIGTNQMCIRFRTYLKLSEGSLVIANPDFSN